MESKVVGPFVQRGIYIEENGQAVAEVLIYQGPVQVWRMNGVVRTYRQVRTHDWGEGRIGVEVLRESRVLRDVMVG